MSVVVRVYLFSDLCPQQEVFALPLDILYVVLPLAVFSNTVYYLFLNENLRCVGR